MTKLSITINDRAHGPIEVSDDLSMNDFLREYLGMTGTKFGCGAAQCLSCAVIIDNPDGTSWGIENAGVQPDYDIEITPQDVVAGRDPQLEKAVEVAMAQIPKTPVYQPKLPAFPIHPGKQEPVGGNSILPMPGSAFPLSQPKPVVVPTTTGKFAEFLGQFDTPMGVVVFKQEGDKLVADAGGERIELTLDPAVKDKFGTQPAAVTVTFERDANGKIAGVIVIIASGREVKGKKVG